MEENNGLHNNVHRSLSFNGMPDCPYHRGDVLMKDVRIYIKQAEKFLKAAEDKLDLYIREVEADKYFANDDIKEAFYDMKYLWEQLNLLNMISQSAIQTITEGLHDKRH